MTKLKDIADRLNGLLTGDGETDIRGVAAIEDAREGEITFLSSRSFEKYLPDCGASAVIVGEDTDRVVLAGRNTIVVKNPTLAFARTAELFEAPLNAPTGVSAQAYVSPSAIVSPEAVIFPFAYVGDGAVIERKAVIFPFCFIGRGVLVGENSIVRPNVTIYDGTIIGKRVIVHAGAVLGKDGFGYVWDGRMHKKIPQLGIVEIGDDVEIGANTCIDRAALRRTVIGSGARIDNLVEIAHNVSVGENTVMAAQVGVAGSTTIGKNVIFGGKVGVKDHVAIGNNVRAAGGTGITKDVGDNSVIGGNPHMSHRDALKVQAYSRKLPELFDRVRIIEERLLSGAGHDRDR